MFSSHIGVSFRLILISVTYFGNANARYVTPEAYSNAVRFLNDLAISASEPQPVLVPVISAQSDTLLSDASEKVEKVDKILQRPIAFSYNNDQDHQASSQVVNAPHEQLVPQARVDQQPDAVDYYKYLARLENEEKDGGGGSENQNNADANKGSLGADSKDNVDIRLPKISNGPNFLLDYNPSLFGENKFALHETKLRPVGFHKNDDNEEQNADGSKTADIILDQHEARPIVLISEPTHQSEVKENHHEESHVEHSDNAGHASQDEGTHAVQAEADSHESGSHAEESHEAKEDGETSATQHGGGSGNYKKGGGKEHHTEHHGIHDEKGEKVYDGKHQHVDVDQGHHDKEGHDDHYTEAGNHKEGHHDEDEYHAEHDHGEEGKRGAEFHEDGEHSKGHSTSGEHNIHKKDEYEKKQEFYDESHEGGEHEKHGEYFHEDDFQKGGHKKSEHEHGDHHKDHYGKEKHFEQGGHNHVDVGHDDGEGHDKHHDHFEKGGHQVDKHGQKKWQYSEGHGHDDNDKHDDNEGHGSKIQEVPKAADGQDSEGHGTSHAEQGAQTLQVAESKGVQNGLDGLHAAESKTDAEHNYGGPLGSHSHHEGGSGDHAQRKEAQSGELQAGEPTHLHPIHAEKNQAQQLNYKGQEHDHGAAGDEKHRYMLVIVDDNNNANGKLEGNE